MSTYTREDWHKHGTFKAVPGQEVAPEIYGEMLDCMPPLGLPAVPATRDYDRGFLVGEPTDFDPVTHRLRYMAFAKRGGRCYYLGLLPAANPN